MTQKTILVIEDEKRIRRVTKRILERANYEVFDVDTGEEGLDALQTDRNFALLILDMNLPTLAGKELFVKIKEIRPSIKTLLISGMPEDEDVEELISLGATAFLQKPYENKAFIQAVDNCIYDEKKRS